MESGSQDGELSQKKNLYLSVYYLFLHNSVNMLYCDNNFGLNWSSLVCD